MTEQVRKLSRRRIVTDVLTTLFGAASLLLFLLGGNDSALIAGAYGLLLGTSTAVVTFCLTRFTGTAVARAENDDERRGSESNGPLGGAVAVFTGNALESDSDVEVDTGWLIGRLENVLVIAGQYTALSIIFAAKSWVRREDTSSENTTYYLAGTLVNFTYSILVGIGVVRVLDLV